jgi:SAM-dependent methyltransferase
MSIAAQVVQLSDIPLTFAATEIRQLAIGRHPEGEAAFLKKFPEFEWSRLSYVQRMLSEISGRLLEVGPGQGYFTQIVARYGKFDKVVAADIVPAKWIPTEVDFIQKSIETLDFPDGHFEVVVCMEVLEHLRDDKLMAGLANIRRMCSGHLIMSMPFYEPLPLPSYHHQQFTIPRIKQMFPNAMFSLLLKERVTRVPWILIEERFGVAAKSNALSQAAATEKADSPLH